ncbi:hypothetical protein AYI68_g1880 [Smittium mucronatum]|uniref:Pinin/SDK/MemA protein domain-containing protein n=1 Tax=Smittium mucronatum TaxID=133383 RepID=A0A1R0H496_9FUNG|nr:hypothetical protein AYI68_g1880 [Smittium mucronatum]
MSEQNDLTLSPGDGDKLMRSEPLDNSSRMEKKEPKAEKLEPAAERARGGRKIEQSSKAAFGRLLGTLVRVKEELEVKTDKVEFMCFIKEKSKLDLEAKLREKLFKERMEVSYKTEDFKKEKEDKLLRERLYAKQRHYRNRLARASMLTTKSVPRLQFLPGKLNAHFKKIIEEQISKVELEFASFKEEFAKIDLKSCTVGEDKVNMDMDIDTVVL